MNSKGEKKFRSYTGEPYGPGFYAFEAMLKEWRDKGDLEGLELGAEGHPLPQRTPEDAKCLN